MSPEGVVIIGVEVALLALLYFMWRSSKRAADEARAEEAKKKEAVESRAGESRAGEGGATKPSTTAIAQSQDPA